MECLWDITSLISTKRRCGHTLAQGGISGGIFALCCEGNTGALLNSYMTQLE